MPERVLVTGSTGFIGSHLTKALKKRGYDVVEFEGDIRKKKDIEKIPKDIDGIFHLAAILPYRKSTIKEIFDVNTWAINNLIMNSWIYSKIIYTSSISVYSEPPKYLPVDEIHFTRPSTLYGISKLMGEFYCRFTTSYLDPIILRYSGVYGLGQHQHEAPYRFIKQALANKPITIYGNGNQSSDFTYIDDIVEGTILAYEKNKPGIYNLTSGEETSIKKLAETIIKITGSKSKIKYINKPSDRPFRFYCDISKAKKTFGYNPRSLKEGLKEYVKKMEATK